MSILHEQILDAIRNDSSLMDIVQTRPDDYLRQLASAISNTRSKRSPTIKYTSLGIAERMISMNGIPGPLTAEVILQKLEGTALSLIASSDPVAKLLGGQIKRQMAHLEGNGIALGSPAVYAMLSYLVTLPGSVLTQPEVEALCDISSQPDPVTEDDVKNAIWSTDGQLLV